MISVLQTQDPKIIFQATYEIVPTLVEMHTYVIAL